MQLKNIPKQAVDGDGVVFGILETEGQVPFEFKGKTLLVPRLTYRGVNYHEGEYFTTTETDTLWMAYVVEAHLRAGGRLSQVCRLHVGIYKRYKFRRRDKEFWNRYRRYPLPNRNNILVIDSETSGLASPKVPESITELNMESTPS